MASISCFLVLYGLVYVTAQFVPLVETPINPDPPVILDVSASCIVKSLGSPLWAVQELSYTQRDDSQDVHLDLTILNVATCQYEKACECGVENCVSSSVCITLDPTNRTLNFEGGWECNEGGGS
jgi:hypothetical protein